MGLLGKSFQDVALRENDKRKKPYWGRVTTSEGIREMDLRILGGLLGLTTRHRMWATAESQSKIDPGRGPETVLWDIKVCARNFEPDVLATGVTYDQMMVMMTTHEVAFSGNAKNIKTSEELMAFIKDKRPDAPKGNVLRLIPAPGQ